MSRLKNLQIAAMAALVAGAVLAPVGAQAQQNGVTRTDLQRHDLSAPGREAIQVRVDLAPGVAFGKHTHPGEEIIYVLEGSLEYQVGDKPPVTLKAGDVLFIPANTPHSARNPTCSCTSAAFAAGSRRCCRAIDAGSNSPTV